jgi:hypothetical protein
MVFFLYTLYNLLSFFYGDPWKQHHSTLEASVIDIVLSIPPGWYPNIAHEEPTEIEEFGPQLATWLRANVPGILHPYDRSIALDPEDVDVSALLSLTVDSRRPIVGITISVMDNPAIRRNEKKIFKELGLSIGEFAAVCAASGSRASRATYRLTLLRLIGIGHEMDPAMRVTRTWSS